MRGSVIVRLACVAGLAGAAASAFAWPKGTPQPNRWELPPASEPVRAEAKAAKARLANTVTIRCLAGHRGDSEVAPENTVPAFRAAAEKNFSFETDLYMTLDGVVYVTHDYNLAWRHGGVNKLATNATWKGELEFADAGQWKGRQWKGTKYPTIDDLLPFVADGRFVILEIKDPRKDLILPKIKEAFARHPNVKPSNLYFQGAGSGWLDRNLPGYQDIACGLSRKKPEIDSEPRDLMTLVKKADPKRVPVWSFRWDEDVISRELVDLAHSRGMKIFVWTVNDAASAWAALGRGVDCVLTDRPTTLWRDMQSY